MNALREELNRALESLSAPRRPALRRSLREDALYATDLPAAAPESVPLFLRTVREKGWTAAERNGWIDLDQVPETPPAGCPGIRGKRKRLTGKFTFLISFFSFSLRP